MKGISARNATMPCLMLGDFNAIHFANERRGSTNSWPAYMDDFNRCIKESGLSDLKTLGLFYTWQKNNPVYFIQRRLDRVLVNDLWLSTFPASSVTCLCHNTSDHTPLLVDLAKTHSSKGKTFKFFNHWCNYPEFRPLVERIWSTPIMGSPMFKVTQKLKLLKGELRALQAIKRAELMKRGTELHELITAL